MTERYNRIDKFDRILLEYLNACWYENILGVILHSRMETITVCRASTVPCATSSIAMTTVTSMTVAETNRCTKTSLGRNRVEPAVLRTCVTMATALMNY